MDFFFNGRYILGNTGREWRRAHRFTGEIHRHSNGSFTGEMLDETGVVYKLKEITFSPQVLFRFTKVYGDPSLTVEFEFEWNAESEFWEGSFEGVAAGITRCTLCEAPHKFFL